MRLAAGLVLGAIALLSSPAAALDPGKFITQYTHQARGADEALPQIR